ncbi:MAG: CoA pyrophosphatase [Deltaproteobacteria bacterium]|nr:CoA pyrophosphatase [Deltaproteobacteria bacterium]
MRHRFRGERQREEMEDMIGNSPGLIGHISDVLYMKNGRMSLFPHGISNSVTASAVLFPLSRQCGGARPSPQPCIIFNKRSQKVKQPGDLCFPGGRIAPHLDVWVSRLLTMPFLPLARWSYWSQWRTWRPRQARRLALLFATSLRESFEEMRLNPFGVNFLGPLPSQSLSMFDRVIYPMVAWIPRQRRFFPNWEVERIVRIPLSNLLDPGRYACYRLRFETGKEIRQEPGTQDFACYLHEDHNEREVLWGATYRIVMAFLDLVFGFRPPDIGSLPVVHGALDENYYGGA